MARVKSAPGIRNRAITRDGHLVGSIASFVIEGDTEITYWIDRSVWGQGLASTALTLFLQEQQTRPLHARAASDNAASIRVLQKAGFRTTGTEISYANARGAEIEETILRLDGNLRAGPCVPYPETAGCGPAEIPPACAQGLRAGTQHGAQCCTCLAV